MLVNRHEQAVFNMGLSFFRNSEDAGDFTQDVFLKTFRSLPGFEGRSRFSTWLYRIAYNTAINAVQRQKEYQSMTDEDRVESRETPERDLLRAAAREGVREALKTLPERFRICMDLYFFYDRSYQEIEVITGYPVNTIKSHMFRAKKLLREKLAGLVEGGIE
jgi:RNA polymerase sigma-70 factor (ECF subfamily)